MPQVIISASAYSIQSKRNTTRYGQINPIPVAQGTAVMLVRANMVRVPRRATITSARLRVAQHRDTTAGRTLEVRSCESNWTSKVTWRNRPDVGTLIDDVTKASGSKLSTRWVFDITTNVQQIIDGTLTNQGWQISCAQTQQLSLRGTPADSRPPDLVVEYAVTPDEPTDLHPASSEISTPKPTLTFDADDEITALEVQIDPEANEAAPEWDSGTVPATGGLLDLADPDGLLPTPYPGLAEGSTTYWRVRQRNAAGWSAWSDWAQLSRIGIGTLTITQPPDGVTSDPTPPIAWSFSGTQTAWRVRLFDDDGDQFAGSGGIIVGDDEIWRPRRGFTYAGQTGYINVDVWDDSDRVATPGNPEYITATLPVTFTPDATVDPITSIAAAQLDATPDVTITGTRTVIPDTVSLYRAIRDSAFTLIGTYDALDIFTSGEGGVLLATNYAPDPSAAGGGFTWAGSSAPLVDDTTGHLDTFSYRFEGAAYTTMWTPEGTAEVTGSGWYKADPGVTYNLRLGSAAVEAGNSETFTGTGDWEFHSFTRPAVPGASAAFYPVYITKGTVWVDDIGFTDGPDPVDFNGYTPDTAEFDYGWAGTPYASPSEKRVGGSAPSFSLIDHSAPMNSRNIRYYVTAGVENKNSPQGPTARIDTRGLGVWITDLETGERAVIWGVEVEQESTEQSIVHEPLNRTNQNYNQRIIRRRLVTYQPQGTVDGLLATVSQPGMPTAEQCERLFRQWRNNDAGHLYELHLGRDVRPVILGDIALAEREENRADDRLLNVSLAWYSQVGADGD